jgi:hypothetical protein
MKSLILISCLWTGCGVTTLYRSVGTLGTGVTVGYRSLDKVDADTQAGIIAKANAGKSAEADKELKEWLPKYKKGRTALDAGSVGVENALKQIPIIEKLATGEQRKHVRAWLAALAKLGLDIVAGLDGVGIKLSVPGLGGK